MKFFFDHFEVLADAPDGVKKLREMILQLAVMGKLVPQDPDDEPASVLLEKIKEEKDRLIKEGKIKKQKLFHPTFSDEIPYKLQKGWRWVRLNEICETITKGSSPKWQGVNYTNKDSGILFITSENVGNFNLQLDKSKYVEKKFNEIEPRSILQKNDFLMNIVGASIGRTAIYHLEEIANINQAVCLIRIIGKKKYVSPQFLLQYFNNPFCIAIMFDKQVDNARANLSMGNIANFKIPLPPLNEQKHIVAKVDRLMSFCDELEKKKEKRESNRISLNNASLDKLLTLREPGEFQEHWQRIVDHFDILYNHPGNVAKLKQSILQLAVIGKLVPQDQNDEPAGVLLEKIKEEKERLIKEGKIKRQKPLPPITDDEKPFELPVGWEWVRLGDITKKLGAGSTPRGGKAVYKNKGVKFLRSQNVWNDGLRIDDVAYITEEIHKSMSGTHLKPGDILLNITGASIGRSAFVPDDFDEGNVSQHVSIVRLVDKSSKAFIHLAIISPYIQNIVFSVQVGISREGLSMSRLQFFPIPFPPLNEQKSIISKVDRLLSLCDRLAESLQEADSKREKLFQAVVNQVQEFKNRT